MGRSGGSGGGRSGGRGGGSFSGGGRSGGSFSGGGRGLFSSGSGRSGGRSNRGAGSNPFGGGAFDDDPFGDGYSGGHRHTGGGFSFLPFLPFLMNFSQRNSQPQQVIPPPPTVSQSPTQAVISSSTETQTPGGASSGGVPPRNPAASSNNSNGPVPFKPQGGMSKTMRIVLIVAIVVLAVALFGLFGAASSDTDQNTIERTPLAPGVVTETGYYEDLDGDWIHQKATLENGLRYFYDKTGVQPYVVILPNGESGDGNRIAEYAQEAYDEVFSDEGHFLLVFCDQGDGSYVCAYALGTQARTVMDAHALGIFEQNLEKNYLNYDLSEEQIFSNTFSETADQIMEIHSAGSGKIGYVIAILLAGAVICVIVIINNKKKKQALEEQQRKQILDAIDQPLEKFSDKEVEELASKYESADK